MINNKTIKAIVVALTLVAGNAVYAGSGGSGMQCTPGGATAIKDSSGNVIACASIERGFGGAITRARGDVVGFSFASKAAVPLQATGQLSLPQVGTVNFYQFAFTPTTPKAIASYGKLPANEKVVRVVIASFNLENQNLNPKVSQAMQKIISAAATNNKWAKSMIWVGRALPGETNYTEVIETYSPLADPSKTEAINYKTFANGSAEFTLPGGTDAQGNVVPAQTTPIDLAPINKQ